MSTLVYIGFFKSFLPVCDLFAGISKLNLISGRAVLVPDEPGLASQVTRPDARRPKKEKAPCLPFPTLSYASAWIMTTTSHQQQQQLLEAFWFIASVLAPWLPTPREE